MLFDTYLTNFDKDIHTSVCIVGAGAAGISLALELGRNGIDVVLLESGGDLEEKETQELYEGYVTDDKMHSPPDKYRQRRFGGSTTIWGGRCMPFDPIDFEKREWIAHSGWPISYNDVAKYYPAASELCELGEGDFIAEELTPRIIKELKSNVLIDIGIERFSCPTNFAERYKSRLVSANNIQVILHANCYDVILNEYGNAVSHILVKNIRDQCFSIKAKHYVLAMGGLETTRLLLASNSLAKNGIGNDHDVVGRYYMCHMAGNVGALKIKGQTKDVYHGYYKSPQGIYCRRRFALTENAQRQHQVGNMIARLHFPRIADPTHNLAVLSGLYWAKSFISYEYGKRLNDGHQPTVGLYLRHLFNIIKDPFQTIRFLWHWLNNRTLAERKFPSVILDNYSNQFTFDVHAEQEPNPNSRILLTNDRDRFGMCKLKIDWRYTATDVETVRKTLNLFAKELAPIAEMTLDDDSLEEELLRFGAYGGHHIGTTRMGNNPHDSVVNENCRLHSVENLYIASSSVFPTSSQANPTLTIVALALRLADHLKKIG